MGRYAWESIKQSKGFYTRIYRFLLRALIFSMALSLCLTLGIGYVYERQQEPNFYATNGATPPEELRPMLSPNYTEYPLLPNDPVRDEGVKAIPE